MPLSPEEMALLEQEDRERKIDRILKAVMIVSFFVFVITGNIIFSLIFYIALSADLMKSAYRFYQKQAGISAIVFIILWLLMSVFYFAVAKMDFVSFFINWRK